MLMEDFIISYVIFACQATLSALYIGKSLEQDHYDLRGYYMACRISHLEFFLMYPGYLLEIG